jgi:hypothetical protein
MTDITEQDQREEDLWRAKEAIAGERPLIPDAPDCLVTLPRGLWFGGAWKTQAEVVELTGADEEALARLKDSSEFFDTVLALGTVHIGDVDFTSRPVAERQGLLRQLLVGERDWLFMNITRVTFGDTRTIPWTCQKCEEEQEVDLVISKDLIPKSVLDLGTNTYHIELSMGDVEYHLVTGEDQAESIKRKNATIPEQNTVLLSRCIVQVNGSLVVDPLNFARKMGMRDRQKILDEMVSRQPLIDTDLDLTCVGCGEHSIVALGWGVLFRS